MGKRIDLTGQRFGRLVVISYNEEVSKQKKGAHWNCKCDCGNEVVVWRGCLKKGHTASCGCYQKEKASNTLKDVIKRQWGDEESRQKKSKANTKMLKEKWQDEGFRRKQSDKTKEKWQDEEFRQMQSNKMREMITEKWKDEEFRRMHKNIEHNYKGGITPISRHLRIIPVVEQWFGNCKQQANYTCELTGKVGGSLHTHHLKAFSTIVKEAHELHNIQVKPQVKDYTKEELHKLEEYVASYHKDASNAVVLSEEAHRLFHSLYGQGGNTSEQYEEFRERYMEGEFKDLI